MLSDVNMPGMNGLELCRVMKQRHPAVNVVLTSAYHLSQRQLELAGIGNCPLTVDEVACLLVVGGGF